ncbi:hypothetical protein B0H67DRAFT_119056 [Lasiosphaeris hirsuta]|uniref:Uncharacterized protein n=1 Tax=Lasiosphaeris hirsuta TaxID=260670 RepID=A0AA40AZM6_9PEZI|nr:hypothetical protein B0H67DRAFT_119056 [Lasiosphaeris hirsuta]
MRRESGKWDLAVSRGPEPGDPGACRGEAVTGAVPRACLHPRPPDVSPNMADCISPLQTSNLPTQPEFIPQSPPLTRRGVIFWHRGLHAFGAKDVMSSCHEEVLQQT